MRVAQTSQPNRRAAQEVALFPLETRNGSPRWYGLALAKRRVTEALGTANNPAVQAYYRDAGHPEVTHDSVPWCAAVASWAVGDATLADLVTKAPVSSAAWALPRSASRMMPRC